MKTILTMMIALMTSLAPCFADDNPAEPDRRPPSKNWDKNREQFKMQIDAVLEKIKEKNPERYNELIKLRETDRRKFMRELRGDLRPEGDRPVHDGENGDGLRRGGHGPSHAKRFGERFLEHLKSQDPERFERIQKLRKENPEEFREEMGKIFSSFRKKHFKKDERVDSLLEEYKKAGTDEEKSAAKEKLRKVIEEGFEKRMKLKENELDSLKQRIDEMEKALDSYRKSKEAICNKRLQELLERGTEDGGPGAPPPPPGRQ